MLFVAFNDYQLFLKNYNDLAWIASPQLLCLKVIMWTSMDGPLV